MSVLVIKGTHTHTHTHSVLRINTYYSLEGDCFNGVNVEKYLKFN